MGIVWGGKMCYTWVNKLSDKSKFKMEMTAMEDMRNIRIMIEEFGHKHPEIKLEKSPISDCDITELERLHPTETQSEPGGSKTVRGK